VALEPEDIGLVRSLFQQREFFDRFLHEPEDLHIDVIIPVLHSNDLWRENLLSYFREIPIKKLILGDAGCIDKTIEISMEFPRVEIVDQTEISTLGASLADLTKRVTTKNFAYLQSDVFLPSGWFNTMGMQMTSYDWVGSPMQIVTMVDYLLDYSDVRPLSGAQMGKSDLFKNLDEFIDDDYVYRQEDFVLEEFVRRRGGVTGKTKDTFHFHEVMRRHTTGMKMNVREVTIKLNENTIEISRVNSSQLQGFIKYCDPLVPEVRIAAFAAYSSQQLSSLSKLKTTLKFVSRNNPSWRSTIYRFALQAWILGKLTKIQKQILKILSSFQ